MAIKDKKICKDIGDIGIAIYGNTIIITLMIGKSIHQYVSVIEFSDTEENAHNDDRAFIPGSPANSDKDSDSKD